MHLRLVPTIGLVAVGSVLANIDENFTGLPPVEDLPRIPNYEALYRKRDMVVRDDLWKIVDQAYPTNGTEKKSGAHYRTRRRLFIVLKEAGEDAPTTVEGAKRLLHKRRQELRREVKYMVDAEYPVVPGDIPYNKWRKSQVDRRLEEAFTLIAKELGLQSA